MVATAAWVAPRGQKPFSKVEEVRELPTRRHADVEEDELEVGLEEVIDHLHV